MAYQAGAYPGFRSMKRLGVFILPLDGILVYRRVTPSIRFAGTYLPGWREVLCESSVLSENTTQRPRSGLEPGPLDPGPIGTNHEATAPPAQATRTERLF